MSMQVGTHPKLTYEDYVLFPENGMIHEIIDGDHYMTPAPATYHQTLSRRIQYQLYEQIEELGLGQVFDAPTDVQLSPSDVVQPDLLVILKERLSIISPTKIIGAPDLIIEILSESTETRDRKLKLDLYCRGAVREYWLVDPVEQIVNKYVLGSGGYGSAGGFHDEIAYDALPGVKVDLTRVW